MSRLVAWFDRWQRRHAVAGFPIAVIKKFTEDRASNLAALIAFYGFFSLFPLLLAFVSVLGFALEGNPSLRDEIIDSAVARIPVIGDQIEDQVQPLTGNAVALAVGLIGALWAGLGVMLAIIRAFAVIWDIPRVEQPNGIKARLRGLAALVVLGLILIAATAVGGLAIGGGIDPLAQRAGALALALVVNMLTFLVGFVLLAGRRRPVREFLPGVVLAGVGALGLQSLGGWYVDYAITDATATYGVFALVIGLLSWFLVGAYVLLIAAEVNVVYARRLWPRSLTGELEPADRRAFERFAAAAVYDRRAQIEVRFDDER